MRWITPPRHSKKQILTENVMFSMSPLSSTEDLSDGKGKGKGEVRLEKERKGGMDCGFWVEGVRDWEE